MEKRMLVSFVVLVLGPAIVGGCLSIVAYHSEVDAHTAFVLNEVGAGLMLFAATIGLFGWVLYFTGIKE